MAMPFIRLTFMKQILLIPFGTSGSIFPFIWLGRHLIERGYCVRMLASPVYRKGAEAAGIAFHSPEVDVLPTMLADAGLWHHTTSKKVAFVHGGNAIDPSVTAIEKIIQEHGKLDLMLAPMISFGARIIREKYRIPMITVHLYPVAMMSADDTPMVFPAMRHLRRLPLPVRKFMLSLPSPYDQYALPAVIETCAKHGVKPPKRLWKDWHHSPDGVLALFPSWFGRVARDQPHNTFQWDFPLEDMAVDQPMEPELEDFLAAGEKPILFTAGSGQFHATEFFQIASRVVARLGCRAVFLTSKSEQVPENLPSSIFVATYAPFSKLLPRASVMVHHGGIGTTSQCFLAGIPQLVVFMALDQPDNAARIERLGVGLSISRKNLTEDRLLPLAKRCLTNANIRASVAQHAELMKHRPSTSGLFDWIEMTLATSLT